MAKTKKIEPTLDELIFNTPEQKVLRLLLLESTTTFNSRTISSKLKGVRGLGGAEGIMEVLAQFKELGLVNFLDNDRSVRLRDDSSFVMRMKTMVALCELEGLKKDLQPLSERGILFGSRATGNARSDSDYDVFIVTKNPEDVKRIAHGHPLGKLLEIIVMDPSQYEKLQSTDGKLAEKLDKGVVLWGRTW